MKENIFNQAQFLLSAPNMAAMPADFGKEIAVIGRSNSGKSTLINAVTGQKKLARVGRTPGVTQLLNVFVAPKDSELRLVDLPGYGFAKAPTRARKNWQRLIWTYLEKRQSLVGLLLLLDVRRPLNPEDREILEFAITNEIDVHIVLTKADKLKRMALQLSLQKMLNLIQPHKESVSVQLFSAHSKIGLDQLQERICDLLNIKRRQ